MIHRSFRYRLYPTPEQEVGLAQISGVTRFIYNLALEQRRLFHRQYRATVGGTLNFVSQGREVTALRREVEWIAAVPGCPLTQALRDLDKAFAAFFAGRARYPTPRRKGINDSFRINADVARFRVINRKWAAVRIPSFGWVRLRLTRPLIGRWLNVTIRRDPLGWHASFACELEHDAPANDNPAVGIDRGITVSLALSNGETFHLPDMKKLERQRRRAQRVLSRRKRGSMRRRKQLRRVARISGKIGRIRCHWQHVVSRSISERFALVVFEKLQVANMSAAGPGKRGLNRSILNQGWGSFATKLAYKLEERGGALEFVNPAYSSQTCSACGAVDAGSRKSQSAFSCVECGHGENADLNAAKVILRRSTASMPVEGRDCAPVEAGTMREAA